MEEFKLPNAINLDLNNLFYDQKDLLSGTNFFENGDGSSTLFQTKWNTIGNYQFYELSGEKWFVGNPCGEGILGGLNNNIQKLFEILKTVQKYNNIFVQGSINKVKKLQGNIRSIISAMAGILKTLVQRVRNWILNKVKGLIENALEQALPPLLKTIKESLSEAIFDQIFCAFEKILKGLFDLVGDFIYSLIGQIINAPLCAIEQWTNALINNLVNKIDSVLNPIFDGINDLLSGVAQISGSVSSAINTILGFQGFLCGQPDCPELQEFINDLNGSASATAIDNFNKFDFISDNFAGEITETANEWLDDFFGKDSNTSQSPGECYTGTFECGIPQIVIFGGGGSGAVAQAVVNKIGQVIGANLLSGGSGYTSPPFVSIVDPAGCGVNANGYAILGENGIDEDSVTEIVIDNPGNSYGQNYTGGVPVINVFRGSPNPIVVGSTLTIDWEVSNADTVSLNVSGYESLPIVGSISIPITTYDVLFEPNEDKTTKIFTLTATKNNLNSASQTISKNFILTVLKEGSPLSSEVNTLQPKILNFKASPNKLNPGEIVNLSWKTENSTSVSLNVDGLNSLPSNGNVSVVIPSKYSFPSDGSNGTETYTLVVRNSNAQSDKQTVTEKTTVTILRPSTDSESNVGSGSTVPISDDVDGDIDDDSNDSSGTGNNNAISSIKDIDIINTGIGYTSGDTVIVDDDDDNGSEFELDVNQIGQIVGIRATSPGYGFTNIPTLSIRSSTGLGADFRVRLKFTPLNEFLNDMKLQTIDPNKLVQVVDCVGTTRATINNPLKG